VIKTQLIMIKKDNRVLMGTDLMKLLKIEIKALHYMEENSKFRSLIVRV